MQYLSRNFLSVVAIALLAGPCRADDTPTPKGLAPSDWSSIRAAYEAGRHAAFADDATPGHFRARNPGQQWRTRFDGRGFLTSPDAGNWTWGLQLVSLGRGNAQQHIDAVAHIHTSGTRVEYIWNSTLTEWFINDQRGVEHGYTLRERPEGTSGPDGMLHFTLAVRGDLTPRVSENGRDVTFTTAAGDAALTYNNLKVFDADGVHMAASFEAVTSNNCTPALRLTIDDTNARYPLTIDPTAQQAYLKATNTGAVDNFGSSVAVSGDTVVVGAYQEDSNATGVNGNQADNSAFDSGAAYVFVRSGTTWTQQAYLKASNSGGGDFQRGDGDRFGLSVAISGDTVVVGAPGEDSSATGVNGNQADNSAFDSGAAYVFVRSGTTWTQQAYLKASNSGGGDFQFPYGDFFGMSVAVSGDTVVVGAPDEDSSATDVNGDQADDAAFGAGAAYIFVRAGSTWTQQAYFKASNTGASDRFGSSVAVSGDTVVVGATGEDSNATGVNGDQADSSVDSGAAYIFVRSGTTWSQQAYIKASNTGQYDEFGYSVAVAGDTVVVGARWESSIATGVNGNQADNSAHYSGAAYVFIRFGTTWAQQAYLKASNTGASDQFGSSVAVSGDTVVVGAILASSDATRGTSMNGDGAGAAYVFVRFGITWGQQPYLKASNPGLDDHFGWSVAVSGDTVVVGALYEDSGATGVNGSQSNNTADGSGAAYIFRLGLPTPIPVNPLPAPMSVLATPASVCGGERSALSVENPGPGIVIDWFADSCDGTMVGTGNPFYVNAETTTAYFARARDTADGNTSVVCVSVIVTVDPSCVVSSPTSPLATPASVCSGEIAALSVDDPGAGIVIDWFADSCDGTLVGTGNPFNVNPTTTTTYYARARRTSSGSTSDACASVTVNVTACACSPADIANTDGDPAPDNAIDNGDFSLFFQSFFLPSTDPARLAADIANTDGDPGADGAIDNGDFTAFFTFFFLGCP
jgi:hypothetical protein